MRPPAQIEAGHILLRRYGSADVDSLLAAVNQSFDHLRPWMPWARDPNTRAGVAAFVARAEHGWRTGSDFNYGIWNRNAGEFVGGCGLHARIGPGALEIGYWIAKAHTRRGYATEAARALTQAALSTPTVTRVEIHCDEANVFSAAIPRALGYRLDRIQDDEIGAPAEVGREMVWVWERPAEGPQAT